mgnify:CR=1 FL=1
MSETEINAKAKDIYESNGRDAAITALELWEADWGLISAVEVVRALHSPDGLGLSAEEVAYNVLRALSDIDGLSHATRIIDLLELAGVPTIGQEIPVDDVLSQGAFYTPECFTEVGSHPSVLIASWKTDKKNSIIVGKVDRSGWNASVVVEGNIVAENCKNTGWGFVRQLNVEKEQSRAEKAIAELHNNNDTLNQGIK